MLIDWFTVAAQFVNFLILIALLKYFLFDRVVRAMEEREKRIASRMEEAERTKGDLEKERERYEEMRRSLEQEREEILSKARREAAEERKELARSARDDVDRMKARWEEGLRDDREGLLHELTETAGSRFIEVAKQAFGEMADTRLERQMAEAFIRRIEGLGDETSRDMAEAFGSADGAVVRSAFDLPDEQRRGISEALKKKVPGDLRIRFETSPGLIAGIEIRAKGVKVGWSLDSYLESLRAAVGNLIDDRTAGRPAGDGNTGQEEPGERRKDE